MEDKMRRSLTFRMLAWILGAALLPIGCGDGTQGKEKPAGDEKAESKSPEASKGGEGEAKGEGTPAKPGIVITLLGGKKEGTFEVGGKALTSEALFELIEKKAAENPMEAGGRLCTLPATIRVGLGVRFENVTEVLMACAGNRIYKITYRMLTPGAKAWEELVLPLPADRGLTVPGTEEWIRIRESDEEEGGGYAVTLSENEHLGYEETEIPNVAVRGGVPKIDERGIAGELSALNAKYRENKPSRSWSGKTAKGWSGGGVSSVPDELCLVVDCPGEVPFEIVYSVLRACKRSGSKSIGLRKTPAGSY